MCIGLGSRAVDFYILKFTTITPIVEGLNFGCSLIIGKVRTVQMEFEYLLCKDSRFLLSRSFSIILYGPWVDQNIAKHYQHYQKCDFIVF